MATAASDIMKSARRRTKYTARQVFHSSKPDLTLAQKAEDSFKEELKLMEIDESEYKQAYNMARHTITKESIALNTLWRRHQAAEDAFRRALKDPQFSDARPEHHIVWEDEIPHRMQPHVERLLESYERTLGEDYNPEEAMKSARTLAQQIELHRQDAHDRTHPESAALRFAEHRGVVHAKRRLGVVE